VAERLGVLAATGLIAGESLFGVVFAGMAAARNSPTPLEIIEPGELALPLGMVLFAAAIAWLYLGTKRAAAHRTQWPVED
jgi:hypothetical protein